MREVSPERLVKDVRRVLENPFWISGLETDKYYERLHDDHDGTYQGNIRVAIAQDGDIYVETDGKSLLRFRMPFSGGGMSPRVRNALLILAYAIKLDNEKKPQHIPQEREK
ncbi:MAG: hypothetical protein Q8N59_01070 [bacterium]|nr:hypothetical protein [bacterium]